MRTRSLIAIAAFCAALVLPGMAAAQSIAYASGDGYTNLRAGPSTRYQVIARLYPGTRVHVLGCLDTRAWCDVVVQDIRGWIYASRLEFVYAGRRVLVPDYYSYFGAPYVFFRFGDDHRRRRHRDDDKPIFGHPGGGGPGPEYVAPVEGTAGVPPVDESLFGHPGGEGPGPEQIAPMEGQTEGVGPDGSGGGTGLCAPGDPNCLESTQ